MSTRLQPLSRDGSARQHKEEEGKPEQSFDAPKRGKAELKFYEPSYKSLARHPSTLSWARGSGSGQTMASKLPRWRTKSKQQRKSSITLTPSKKSRRNSVMNAKRRKIPSKEDQESAKRFRQRRGSVRKLFTNSRKSWKTLKKAVKNPLLRLFRSNHGASNAQRGSCLLYNCKTDERVALAEVLEKEGFHVVQESMPQAAVAALKKFHNVNVIVVSFNHMLKHENCKSFLDMLAEQQNRLRQLPVALLLDSATSKHVGGIDEEGRKREIPEAFRSLSCNRAVRAILLYPDLHNREAVLKTANRIETLATHEESAESAFVAAGDWDFAFKKRYLHRREVMRQRSGHRYMHYLVRYNKILKRDVFRAWRDTVREIVQDLFKADGKAAAAKVRSRRLKRLRRKVKLVARTVSMSQMAHRRSIIRGIAGDPLLIDIYIPTWLPGQMIKLYLRADAKDHDLAKSMLFFSREIARRTVIWPRICRALAMMRRAAFNSKYYPQAEQELSHCIFVHPKKQSGELLFNRSAVRARQGDIDGALADMATILSGVENEEISIEKDCHKAVLHNRGLIHRRFGRFLKSNKDNIAIQELNEEKSQEDLSNSNGPMLQQWFPRNPEICSNSDNVSSETSDSSSVSSFDSDDDLSNRGPRIEVAGWCQGSLVEIAPSKNWRRSSLASYASATQHGRRLSIQSPVLSSSAMNGEASKEKLLALVQDFHDSKLSLIAAQETEATAAGDESSSSSDSSDSEEEVSVMEPTNEDAQRSAEKDHGENLPSINLEVGRKDNKTSREEDNLDSSRKNDESHVKKTNKEEKGDDASLYGKAEFHIAEKFKELANKPMPSEVWSALLVRPMLRTRHHLRQIRYITDTMKVFSTLPLILKEHLCKVLRLHTTERNEVICRQGDKADNFYVVVSGELRVEIQNPKDKNAIIVVNIMKAGTGFGELALVFKDTRSATVAVDVPGAILVIPGDQFRVMGLADYFLKILEDKYKTLCHNPIFNSWNDENLTALAKVAMIKTYPPGKVIISQGSNSEYFYVVRHGIVEVMGQTDEAAELKKEEAALMYELERMRTKRLLHHSYSASNHVRLAAKADREVAQKLMVVKSNLKRVLMIPKKESASHITYLYPDAFFGENAIISPDRRERTSVVAKTFVELLVLAKPQIRSKWITATFVAALKQGMVTIPPADMLRLMERRGQKWIDLKASIVSRVDSSRHPSQTSEKNKWY